MGVKKLDYDLLLERWNRGDRVTDIASGMNSTAKTILATVSRLRRDGWAFKSRKERQPDTAAHRAVLSRQQAGRLRQQLRDVLDDQQATVLTAWRALGGLRRGVDDATRAVTEALGQEPQT